MTWDDWITKHAATFGIDRDAELSMINEWAALFATAGFTADVMAEATKRLALGEHPRYRRDHLPALLSLAREIVRLQTALGSSEAADVVPGASCELCQGNGLVSVPAGRCGKGLATRLVYCSCHTGARRAACCPRQGQTLIQYERERPGEDWHAELAQHAEEQKRYASARSAAESCDRDFGAILDAIRRRG